jgi:hypothetical protein
LTPVAHDGADELAGSAAPDGTANCASAMRIAVNDAVGSPLL